MHTYTRLVAADAVPWLWLVAYHAFAALGNAGTPLSPSHIVASQGPSTDTSVLQPATPACVCSMLVQPSKNGAWKSESNQDSKVHFFTWDKVAKHDKLITHHDK